MDRIRSCVKRDLAERLIKLQHDGVLFDSGRHKAMYEADEHGRDELSGEYDHDEWVRKFQSLVDEFKKLHDDLDDYYIAQSEDLG